MEMHAICFEVANISDTCTQLSSTLLETRAAQIFMCIQITWESCLTGDTIHLAWGGVGIVRFRELSGNADSVSP